MREGRYMEKEEEGGTRCRDAASWEKIFFEVYALRTLAFLCASG